MGAYRKKIHLEKSEATLVIILVVLISGMTFTMGVMVGMGVAKHKIANNASHPTRSHASTSSDGEVVAAPAKLEDQEMALMKAYKSSKQVALDALKIHKEYEEAPKSVADHKAHFKKKLDKERAPASKAKPKLDEIYGSAGLKSEKSKQAKKEEKGPTRVPSSVKGLFEKAPEDLSKFVPTPEQWTVQIASYPTPEQALNKLSVLRKNKVADSYVKSTKTSDGEIWHSVFVGSYTDKKWSERMAKRLLKRKLAADYKIKKIK